MERGGAVRLSPRFGHGRHSAQVGGAKYLAERARLVRQADQPALAAARRDGREREHVAVDGVFLDGGERMLRPRVFQRPSGVEKAVQASVGSRMALGSAEPAATRRVSAVVGNICSPVAFKISSIYSA